MTTNLIPFLIKKIASVQLPTRTKVKQIKIVDPRISRMIKKSLKICPKFLDLYASIYGNSKTFFPLI
jgi:hypothetical protein